MKLSQSKLHSTVCKLMSEMDLLDRPATTTEITRICQTVLAETERRKSEPSTHRVGLPENPDEESAKAALFSVMRPVELCDRLASIPSSECYIRRGRKKATLNITTHYARFDEILEVLVEFGLWTEKRRRPSGWGQLTRRSKRWISFSLPDNWPRPSEDIIYGRRRL